MSKTILYIGFFGLPDKDAAANRVMNNAKAIRDAGNTVIFMDEQIELGCSSIEDSLHNVDGFDVWTMQRPKDFKSYIQKMISIRQIECVVNQYKTIDLIVAYNYPAIALKRLRQYCILKKIKLVSDCTEWYSGQEYKFPQNILCAIDSGLRMKCVQKKIDGIICISSYLKNYYKASSNLLEIPPLVDSNSECWKQSVYEYAFDDDKLNLVYAGNPGKSKEKILPILEAISKSKNKERICFRIVGMTKENFLTLFPKYEIQLEKLEDSIKFLGRLSHDETIRHIKSADYMIFLRESNRVSNAGFSTKFVESITCMTAVITSDTGDLKKYIDNYKIGFIINSVDELVRLLDSDVDDIKSRSHVLNKGDIFDYHSYVLAFKKWIDVMYSN